MLLGLGLMVAEAFVPAFGTLGVGGMIAFLLGATILIDVDAPGFALSWPVVAGIAVASLAFSALVLRLALSARRRRVVSGRESLIGAPGTVLDWNGLAGHVFVQGERWQATAQTPLSPKQNVRVLGLEGLTLAVDGDGAKTE
jgi:membrane-bound serine protease (ClpP class)